MTYEPRPQASQFSNKIRDLIEVETNAPLDDRLSVGEVVGALMERVVLTILDAHEKDEEDNG